MAGGLKRHRGHGRTWHLSISRHSCNSCRLQCSSTLDLHGCNQTPVTRWGNYEGVYQWMQHGIRAGCPLWCLCWARVSLSGCCCEVEAPLGHEPEGLNESSTWEREQEGRLTSVKSCLMGVQPLGTSSDWTLLSKPLLHTKDEISKQVTTTSCGMYSPSWTGDSRYYGY